jgi:hypothetical protein
MHCDNHSVLCSREESAFDSTELTALASAGTVDKYAIQRRSLRKPPSVSHVPIDSESSHPRSVFWVSDSFEKKSSDSNPINAKGNSGLQYSFPFDIVPVNNIAVKSYPRKARKGSSKIPQEIPSFISVAYG